MSEAPVERSGLDLGAAIVKAVVMCLILAPIMAYFGGVMLWAGIFHPTHSPADSAAVLLGLACLATALNIFVIGLGSEGW